MPSAKTLKALGTVVVAVIAVVLAMVLSSQDSDSSATAGSATSSTSASVATSAQKSSAQQVSSDAPARVLATLVEIDAGRWPDSANAVGTKGGVTFRNSEGRLPAVGAGGGRVVYQEWDVNPKKNGQGRDAERIVTGNDGSAWYTLDHYETFTRIR
ncbi:ribonuclease N [Rhodococcus sp. KBS0724]|uniref:ribonuclease domain-containing protein n=1 Tax=Rhodococcus sp. KBS0724 TaxID=1179674 RepID=UPI00110E3E0C|nr:ribonuclease domain-containing protein [Rhodococcus sp. KBS0724]TSD48266.1 ribonuclease N [Rhodococcus sp. KBS0724]